MRWSRGLLLASALILPIGLGGGSAAGLPRTGTPGAQTQSSVVKVQAQKTNPASAKRQCLANCEKVCMGRGKNCPEICRARCEKG
jgi:hypothetical protein